MTVADYRTCTYRWTTSDWSTETRGISCGGYIQFRDVLCTRSDGVSTSSSPNDCDPSTKPDREQTAYEYAGCRYDWQTGDWTDTANSPSCGSVTQTRPVSCQRSDGTQVGDTACAASGAKPEETQTFDRASGCAYAWHVGEWTDPAAPTTCGAMTQSRAVYCARSDGTQAGDAYCTPTAAKPSSTQDIDIATGCTYSWVPGAWTDPANATTCGKVTQTRTMTCMRSDKTQAPNSFCTATRPATSQQVDRTSTCTYTATYSSTYGACTGGLQYAPISKCTRSDTTVVDNSFCSPQQLQKSCTVTHQCDSMSANTLTPASFNPGGAKQLVSVSGMAVGSTVAQRNASALAFCMSTTAPDTGHTYLKYCEYYDNGGNSGVNAYYSASATSDTGTSTSTATGFYTASCHG